jgi:opacity protein-like surface antigen
MEVKDDHTGLTSASDKDTGFHLGFGAGLEYQVTDAVGVRLTAERIQLRDVELLGSEYDVDLDQATLGVQFSF